MLAWARRARTVVANAGCRKFVAPTLQVAASASAAAVAASPFAAAESAGSHGSVVVDLVSGAGAEALAAAGSSALSAYLRARLPAWAAAASARGGAAAWLRAPLRAPAGTLDAAADAGFAFHHARGEEAMLLLWLGAPTCRVPPLASHQVGAGGAVVDDFGNLLVVRERGGRAGGHASGSRPAPFAWKIPGGLADAGEDFAAAACREVFEETGARTAFVCVLGFREAHGTAAFGTSDLYFVCLLRLLPGGVDSAGLQPLKPDAFEVSDAAWMDAESFAAATTHPVNAVIAREALGEAVRRGLCPRRPASAVALSADRDAGGSVADPVAIDGSDCRAACIEGVQSFSPVTRRWATFFLPHAAAVRVPPTREPGDVMPNGAVVPPRPVPRPLPWV